MQVNDRQHHYSKMSYYLHMNQSNGGCVESEKQVVLVSVLMDEDAKRIFDGMQADDRLSPRYMTHFANAVLAAAAPAAPAAAPCEESAEDAWRRLALQFDGHRMQALCHLRAMLQDAQKHAPLAEAFLKAPPLDGEAVLAQRIAASQQPQPTQAAQDVLTERQRQVGAEGWTSAHDDQYQNDELSLAAACYTIASDTATQAEIPQMWPWPDDWWKPTTERRNLVKAGALILAEIERLDRASLAKKGGAA